MGQRFAGSGAAAAAVAAMLVAIGCAQSPMRDGGYAVDAAWPKPLPNNWTLGQVAGIAVDARDHVWLIHRPKTLIDEEKGAALSPPRAKCCTAAPPVIEFDGEGNLLRAWGGPGAGYEWFENEHGIYIDQQGNIWVGGNDPRDHQLIKFTPDGKFLMQIGRAGQTGGSNSTTLLGRPAHMQIAAVREPGALRAPVERRPGLRLRPRQQPRAGVQEGRNLREAAHVRGEVP